MLLALVLYCYSKGIRSSRKIEAACLDDVGCRIITANQRIDHATVARFIRRHRRALKELFVQVLALCVRRGLVDASVVAIDGSPMQANADREANRNLERLEQVIAKAEADIEALLQHAGDYRADGTSAVRRLSQLGTRAAQARLARTRLHQRALPSAGEIQIKIEAAERMVTRAEHRLARVTAVQQATLDSHERRAREDRAAGRRGATGRPPVPLQDKAVIVKQRARLARARAHLEHARDPRPTPSPTARACLTDPDSRLMPGKKGGYCQGYNIQLASTRRQILLAIELQDNPSDMTALIPMVAAARRNCAAAGIPGPVTAWLADSGYASTANFEALAQLPLLVAVTRERTQLGLPSIVPPSGEPTISAGHQAMAERLATEEGRILYKQRGALVEPGFAQLFQRFGRRLNYRGTDNVDTEIKLLGTVHNLNKLMSHRVNAFSLDQ